MFGKRKPARATKLDTWVGRKTELAGDLKFNGAVHVDGVVRGDVIAEGDNTSVLSLSEHGTIEGNVRVPHVVVNGVVVGDVHASVHIELASNARITGNVYYQLIEMATGAEVNGNLVHESDAGAEPPKLTHETEPA